LAEELRVLRGALMPAQRPARKKKRPQPAKRAPSKKSPVKRAASPAGRPPTKRIPVKKISTRKRPLPAKRAPAKKVPSKKAPVKPAAPPRGRLPGKKAPAKRAPVKKKPLPTKKGPARKRPLPPKKKPVKKRPLPARRPPVKRGPLPKKRPKKPEKHRYPSFMRQAGDAEALILEKLGRLQGALSFQEPTLDTTVKTFVNTDATVDGELRMRNLPSEWRKLSGMPSLMATLSEAVRAMGAFPVKPPMGGAFWVSFGVRFGPKDKREIEQMAKFYKRFRGLLQVGAHHATAQNLSAILNNALTVRFLIERLWHKRDLPPVQLLFRVVWTPTTDRPGRFAGEEGGKE
jgi:hypothetical protein